MTAVTGNGTITPDAGHSGCTTTGVTFTDQSGLTLDIAASTSTQFTLTGAASMSNASDERLSGRDVHDPCQPDRHQQLRRTP